MLACCNCAVVLWQEMREKIKDEDTVTSVKVEAEPRQPPDIKPSVASLPLPPFDPHNPIGQFLHPVISRILIQTRDPVDSLVSRCGTCEVGLLLSRLFAVLLQ